VQFRAGQQPAQVLVESLEDNAVLPLGICAKITPAPARLWNAGGALFTVFYVVRGRSICIWKTPYLEDPPFQSFDCPMACGETKDLDLSSKIFTVDAVLSICEWDIDWWF
jgi:hypothetical protein